MPLARCVLPWYVRNHRPETEELVPAMTGNLRISTPRHSYGWDDDIRLVRREPRQCRELKDETKRGVSTEESAETSLDLRHNHKSCRLLLFSKHVSPSRAFPPDLTSFGLPTSSLTTFSVICSSICLTPTLITTHPPPHPHHVSPRSRRKHHQWPCRRRAYRTPPPIHC